MHHFRAWALTLGILAVACGNHVVVERNKGADQGGGGSEDPTTTTTSNTGGGGAGPSTTTTSSTGGIGGTPTGTGGSGGEPPIDIFGPPAMHHECISAQWMSIDKIDLESHAVESIGTAPQYWFPQQGQNWVLEEDAIFDCYSGAITRHDLVTHQMQTSNAPCQVTARAGNGGFIAGPAPQGFEIYLYAGFGAAQSGNAQPLTLHYQNAQMIATHGSVLYTSPSFGSAIGRYSLLTGEDLGALQIVGFQGYIDGFAVTDDGLIVLNGSSFYNKLSIYDALNGAWLYDVPLQWHYGLTCKAIY